MKFKTDGGGFATSCDDIKFLYGSSTWATRLSQIANTQKRLIKMTYGFKARNAKYPNEDIRNENSYVRNILNKHPQNVFILCNSEHNKDINANIVLLEPHTVFFASDNFGYSSYDEFGIGIHSKEIYDNLIGVLRLKWKTSFEL